MPDETHPLEKRVVKLESDMSAVQMEVRGLRDKIDENGRDTKEHLSRQDQKLEVLPKIELALIGDGGDVNRGVVRKLDDLGRSVGLWNWVWAAIFVAFAGSVCFAVAAYIIHR